MKPFKAPVSDSTDTLSRRDVFGLEGWGAGDWVVLDVDGIPTGSAGARLCSAFSSSRFHSLSASASSPSICVRAGVKLVPPHGREETGVRVRFRQVLQ
eukprot:213667-Prorocentrum_minimum.AAC.1